MATKKMRSTGLVLAALLLPMAATARDLGSAAMATGSGLAAELLPVFRGEAASVLAGGAAEPRALASADFDEDGVPDLAMGYGVQTEGILAILRGNPGALRFVHPARRSSSESRSPFHSNADAFFLPLAADYLAAGDFDADGHFDLVVAGAESGILWWLLGDGGGAFPRRLRTELPGPVTLLRAGEIGRRDGLADLAVGIQSAEGSSLVLLAGPEGAMRAEAEVIPMPDSVIDLTFGEFDERFGSDILAATASSSVEVSVPDRRLSVGASVRGSVGEIETRILGARQSISASPREPSLTMRLDGDAFPDLVVAEGDGLRLIYPAVGGTTHTVNSTGDTSDSDTSDGVCDTGGTVGMDAECTLRAAIEQANFDAGSDTIEFSISGAGPHTIQPSSLLPEITDPVTIDGTTEPDYAGEPIVELDGTSAGSGHGLVISAGSSTIRGLVINRFDSSGIWLKTAGGNLVEGNWVGTDNAGTAAASTTIYNMGIQVDSDSNTIGGTTATARNVISGNGGRGIYIYAASNQVQGNYIGTDKTGAVAIGNGNSDPNVWVGSGNGNTIGGTTAGAGNLISGAVRAGILVYSGSGALIQGNLIGTDAAGTADLGNGHEGLYIGYNSSNTVVGGTTPAARNVISGNVKAGVEISGSTGVLVQGNYLGTDATGVVAMANQAGVKLLRGDSCTVGGTAAGAGNVISGNSIGVWAEKRPLTTTGTLIQGNAVGVDINGDPLGNTVTGVDLRERASYHTIGGTDPGAGNEIAHNGGRGVWVSYSWESFVMSGNHSPWFNAILGNSIHDNGDLGIDLLPWGGTPTGVTANDPLDADSNGGNQLQNFPVLDWALNDDDAGTTAVSGSLNSQASKTYRIEFFSSTACDASGHGEGEVYLGATSVMTDGSGDATFLYNPPSQLPLGRIVTAAATDPSDNTSEFSACVEVAVGAELSITKADGGATGIPGGTVSYTLTYGNVGATAGGVTLIETVPAHTTFNPGASTAGWVCAPDNSAGSTCTLSVGTVASEGGGSATFAVTIDNPVDAGVDQISNTASIPLSGTGWADPTPADNSSMDTTPVTAAPDLAVSKSDGGATGAPGGEVAYTLSYSNGGNQGATGVALTETVPASTVFAPGSSTAGWACVPDSSAGSACTLSIGSLAGGGGGGAATFVVTVDSPLAAGVDQISNTASIADDGANGADTTPGDNSDSDTTPVTAAPDLAVVKSDGDVLAIPGAEVAYTLNYSNGGSQGATGVVLSETVPANTTFVPGSSTAGWACVPDNTAGSTCTLSIGALAGGGGSGSATFAVTVDDPLAGGVSEISNTASIADDGANGADTNGTDNSSTDTTTVPPKADAGPDRTIASGDAIDPDTETIVLGGFPAAANGTPPYSYAWAITPGADGVDFTLSSATEANPSFTGHTEDTYTAELTITDDNSLTDVDTAELEVICPQVRDIVNTTLMGTQLLVAYQKITSGLTTIGSGASITFQAPAVEVGDEFLVEDGATLVIDNTTPLSCP